jgi:hypothetical protein
LLDMYQVEANLTYANARALNLALMLLHPRSDKSGTYV